MNGKVFCLCHYYVHLYKNVSSKIRRQRAAQCKFRKMSIIKCVFFIYIKLKKKICKIFIINIVIFSYLKIF